MKPPRGMRKLSSRPRFINRFWEGHGFSSQPALSEPQRAEGCRSDIRMTWLQPLRASRPAPQEFKKPVRLIQEFVGESSHENTTARNASRAGRK